jgi:hypothetical protein
MPNGSITIPANPGTKVASESITVFDQITGALEKNTQSGTMAVVNQGVL